MHAVPGLIDDGVPRARPAWPVSEAANRHRVCGGQHVAIDREALEQELLVWREAPPVERREKHAAVFDEDIQLFLFGGVRRVVQVVAGILLEHAYATVAGDLHVLLY